MQLNHPGISLVELLKLSVFDRAEIVSGKAGLDRIVRYVDILEVPELKGWGREGELLLTTGYAFKDNPAQMKDLLRELIKVNAAALIIKADRFIGQLSQDVLELSEKENFPILQLPNDVPYIDITHEVLEQVLQKQAALLRKSEKIYRDLTKLVINNDDVHAVARHVSHLLQSPIWLLDTHKRILASSVEDMELSEEAKQWKITADHRHMGYLAVMKQELDELDMACIEQAQMAFSLKFLQQQVQYDTEKRLQGDFLQELLIGISLTENEIVERGRQLELSPDLGYQAVVLKQKPADDKRSFMNNLNAYVKKFGGKKQQKMYVLNNGHLLVLILASAKDTDMQTKIQEELTAFLAEWPELHAGIGRSKRISELSESYFEAKQSLEIGRRLHTYKQSYFFHQYEYFHLLVQSYNRNWEEIIRERIGNLILHDREKGTDFLTTLFHYLDTNRSLMETASRMFIHRNSVKYRIDKIKEIIGVPFETELDKFGHYIAIALYLLKRGS